MQLRQFLSDCNQSKRANGLHQARYWPTNYEDFYRVNTLSAGRLAGGQTVSSTVLQRMSLACFGTGREVKNSNKKQANQLEKEKVLSFDKGFLFLFSTIVRTRVLSELKQIACTPALNIELDCSWYIKAFSEASSWMHKRKTRESNCLIQTIRLRVQPPEEQ